VPVTDIFRMGVTLYYTLDQSASIDVRPTVLWLDEKGDLVTVDTLGVVTLPAGTQEQRLFYSFRSGAPANRSLYAAVQLAFSHQVDSATAIFDLHGVTFRPLLPPSTSLDPDGFLVLTSQGTVTEPTKPAADAPADRPVLPAASAGGVLLPRRVRDGVPAEGFGIYAFDHRLWWYSSDDLLVMPIGYSGVKLYRPSDQSSIADGVWTPIAWIDPVIKWGFDTYHSTVVGQREFLTAPYKAVYQVHANASFDTNSAGDRGLRIRSHRFGAFTEIEASKKQRATANGQTDMSIAAEVWLERSEQVSIEVRVDTSTTPRRLLGGETLSVSIRLVTGIPEPA